MKYTTITRKGHELTAEWIKDHIELIVWDTTGVWVEWAFSQSYAVYRFQWLLEHA